MLDREGFRPNVGIILLNQKNQVFWGKRIRTHSWQFPQGGINYGETPEQAMFRELHEEVGLMPDHVRIVARTRDWLRYEVPDHFIRRDARGHYRGQKQIWFLLQLDRPRQRHEPARHRPSGVRRLALERLLGAAGRRDRVQARRLPDGADRARALPAARRQHNRYLRSGMRPHHREEPERVGASTPRRRMRRHRPHERSTAWPLLETPLKLRRQRADGLSARYSEHEVVAVDQLGLVDDSRAIASISPRACARSAAPSALE